DPRRVGTAQVVIKNLAPDRQVSGPHVLDTETRDPAELGLVALDIAAGARGHEGDRRVAGSPTILDTGSCHTAGDIEQRILKRDTSARAGAGKPIHLGKRGRGGDETGAA